MKMDVTPKQKCYTFVCVGCGYLSESERIDQTTCSGSCRVKAHRTGKAKELRELAKAISKQLSHDTRPSDIQRFQALKILVPEMAIEMIDGNRKFLDEESRSAASKAFAAKLARLVND